MLHLDPVDWIFNFSTAVHMEEVAIKSTLICSMICMSPWQRLIGAKPESELILAFMEIIASVRDVTKPRFRSGLFLCCSKEHWSIRSFLCPIHIWEVQMNDICYTECLIHLFGQTWSQETTTTTTDLETNTVVMLTGFCLVRAGWDYKLMRMIWNRLISCFDFHEATSKLNASLIRDLWGTTFELVTSE